MVDWVVELGGFVFEAYIVVGEDGLQVLVALRIYSISDWLGVPWSGCRALGSHCLCTGEFQRAQKWGCGVVYWCRQRSICAACSKFMDAGASEGVLR